MFAWADLHALAPTNNAYNDVLLPDQFLVRELGVSAPKRLHIAHPPPNNMLVMRKPLDHPPVHHIRGLTAKFNATPFLPVALIRIVTRHHCPRPLLE